MAAVTSTSSNSANDVYSAAASGNTAASSQSSATSSSGSSALANESTFLTLLVAQLKNQDPSQPADGMQFVTQLAQFSSLEQNLAMRTDLDSINAKIASMAKTSTSNANSSTTGAGSSSAVQSQ